MATRVEPPNTKLMPPSRPSAQTSLPGNSKITMPARTRSMTPLTSIHSNLPDNSRRWAIARKLITTPSTMKNAIARTSGSPDFETDSEQHCARDGATNADSSDRPSQEDRCEEACKSWRDDRSQAGTRLKLCPRPKHAPMIVRPLGQTSGHVRIERWLQFRHYAPPLLVTAILPCASGARERIHPARAGNVRWECSFVRCNLSAFGYISRRREPVPQNRSDLSSRESVRLVDRRSPLRNIDR